MKIDKLNEGCEQSNAPSLLLEGIEDLISEESEDAIQDALSEEWESAMAVRRKGVSQRKINNLLFVGDMGVGKTVEAEEWVELMNKNTPEGMRGLIKWVPLQTSEMNNLVGPIAGIPHEKKDDDIPTEELEKAIKKMGDDFDKAKAEKTLEIYTMPTFEGLSDPDYKYTILFLDEINRGTSFVLGYLGKILNERRVVTYGKNGVTKGYPQWLFTVACMNPRTVDHYDEKTGKVKKIDLNLEVSELPGMIADRFVVLPVYASTRAWCDYMLRTLGEYKNHENEADEFDDIGEQIKGSIVVALREGHEEWAFEDAFRDPVKYSEIRYRVSPRSLTDKVIEKTANISASRIRGLITNPEKAKPFNINVDPVVLFKKYCLQAAGGQEREFVKNIVGVVERYYRAPRIDIKAISGSEAAKEAPAENNADDTPQKNDRITQAFTNFNNASRITKKVRKFANDNGEGLPQTVFADANTELDKEEED